MHEEHEITNKIDQVIFRTGQYVLRPSKELFAALLRASAKSAAGMFKDSVVGILGNFDFLGDTGLITLSKLQDKARNGTSLQELPDGDTAEFMKLMNRFKIPVATWSDPQGKRYLVFRREDTEVVTKGFEELLADKLREQLAGADENVDIELTKEQEEEISKLINDVKDVDEPLSVENALKLTDLEWNRNENGFETSIKDDLGNDVHCCVDNGGSWEVYADGIGARGGRELLSSGGPAEGEAPSIGDALLNAAASVHCLMSAAARQDVKLKGIGSPEEARAAAQNAIIKNSGSDLDLGQHNHLGI